jgi:hypothetical protein
MPVPIAANNKTASGVLSSKETIRKYEKPPFLTCRNMYDGRSIRFCSRK